MILEIYNSVLKYFDEHGGLQSMIELIVLIVLLWEKGIGSFCKRIQDSLLRKIKCVLSRSKRLVYDFINHIFIWRISSHINRNSFRHVCDCQSNGRNEEHHFHIIKRGYFSYEVIINYWVINTVQSPGQISKQNLNKPETVFKISPFSKKYFRGGLEIEKPLIDIKKYRSKYKIKGIDENAASEFFKKFER